MYVCTWTTAHLIKNKLKNYSGNTSETVHVSIPESIDGVSSFMVVFKNPRLLKCMYTNYSGQNSGFQIKFINKEWVCVLDNLFVSGKPTHAPKVVGRTVHGLGR